MNLNHLTTIHSYFNDFLQRNLVNKYHTVHIKLKLNVHRVSLTLYECLIYVQFTLHPLGNPFPIGLYLPKVNN